MKFPPPPQRRRLHSPHITMQAINQLATNSFHLAQPPVSCCESFPPTSSTFPTPFPKRLSSAMHVTSRFLWEKSHRCFRRRSSHRASSLTRRRTRCRDGTPSWLDSGSWPFHPNPTFRWESRDSSGHYGSLPLSLRQRNAQVHFNKPIFFISACTNVSLYACIPIWKRK